MVTIAYYHQRFPTKANTQALVIDNESKHELVALEIFATQNPDRPNSPPFYTLSGIYKHHDGEDDKSFNGLGGTKFYNGNAGLREMVDRLARATRSDTDPEQATLDRVNGHPGERQIVELLSTVAQVNDALKSSRSDNPNDPEGARILRQGDAERTALLVRQGLYDQRDSLPDPNDQKHDLLRALHPGAHTFQAYSSGFGGDNPAVKIREVIDAMQEQGKISNEMHEHAVAALGNMPWQIQAAASLPIPRTHQR